MNLHSGVKIQCLTQGPEAHFFGYFDKTPWLCKEGKSYLLAHELDEKLLVASPGNPVKVGFVQDQIFTPFAETNAWNFQQGSMLQWVPYRGRSVVFNAVENGGAIGVLMSLENGSRRKLGQAVAALSRDGGTALSINFPRLNTTAPGYGYAGLPDPYAKESCPADDGIWTIDLNSGKLKLLLSIRAIARFGENGNPPGAYHWINHLQFNSDNTRFCFLHRFRNSAGSSYTRLMTANRDGSGLKILLNGMASHYDWRNADELVIWAGERKILDSAIVGSASFFPLGQILRRLYRKLGKPRFLKRKLLNDRYLLINDGSGSKITLINPALSSDGHCSFSPDRQWMITDTYPDRHRSVSLLLYHWPSAEVTELARMSSPVEFEDESRCDLHPRWSPDGQRICIDSAHSGVRQIYAIDISKIIQQKSRKAGKRA